MRAAAVTILALFLAGCGEGGGPSGDDVPATTTAPPPGWSRDACDQREPAFSPSVRALDVFRRPDSSAEDIATRIAESVDDALQTSTMAEQVPGRNDAVGWQTRQGTIEVFWETDEAAWSAAYVASLPAPPEMGLEQASHAVAGALGVPEHRLEWSATGVGVRATVSVNGTRMPFLEATDTEMQAEQATLVRREIAVHPVYDVADAGLGVEAARTIADQVLACKSQAAGQPFRLVAGDPDVRVVSGHSAYWFAVEPVQGWDACTTAMGRLHVAIDATTGVVLSSDVACGTG
jgi:hypothetical protein